MGAVPEQFVAAAAHEELVQPAVGLRRDAVAQRFFGDTAQLAAAAHAARPADGEAKLTKHQRQLLWTRSLAPWACARRSTPTGQAEP